MTLLVGTYFWQPDEGSKFDTPYTIEDVRRLQRGVAQNLTVPHEFVVVTDQPDLFEDEVDIRAVTIDKATHVPGTCYVRLMTFHPEGKLMFEGERLLQLDLDSLVVGNLDHLARRDDEDLILWHNPTRDPRRPGRSFYNTSISSHKLGSLPELWQVFVDANGKVPAKDDQWYLSDALGQDMPYFDGERDGVYRIARSDTPGSGVDGELPDNACIVFFTGSEGKWTNPVIRAANPWIEDHLA